MRGDVPAAFAGLRAQYDAGADPAVILSDLASFTHLVTRLKLVPDAAKDPALTEAERKRGAEFAQQLSTRTLSRAWQILLRGVPETQAASRPVAAAEMVLVRLAYAANLPTPDEALRALKTGAPQPSGEAQAAPAPRTSSESSLSGGGPALAASQARPQPAAPREAAPQAAPSVRLRRFEDVVALAGERREIGLKSTLERDVRLVRFEEGQIEFALTESGNRKLPGDLARALDAWTGRRWVVALSSEPGAPTIHDQRQAAERERKSGAAGHPLVQAVMAKFPGAQIVDVREKSADAAEDGAVDVETEVLGDVDMEAARETEPDERF